MRRIWMNSVLELVLVLELPQEWEGEFP